MSDLLRQSNIKTAWKPHKMKPNFMEMYVSNYYNILYASEQTGHFKVRELAL